MVEAIAFMDEAIGMTCICETPHRFCLRAADFHVFSDGTANTLGALVNIYGSSSSERWRLPQLVTFGPARRRV